MRGFLWIGLLYLAACKSSPHTDTSPPFTYEEKTEEFKECIDDACATVDLTYPIFKGETALTEAINSQIEEQNKQMWVTGDHQYTDLEDAVSSFFATYREFRTDYPKAAVQEWTFETVAQVTFLSDSVISIKFQNFSFLGGAHPNTVVNYLNLDLSAGAALLTQEKMLVNREKLIKLALERFREHHEVKAETSLENDGRFFLEDGEFFLPIAMGYEGNDFVLVYNSYEIGPYVMGRTELRFPLQELEGIVYQGSLTKGAS